MQPEAYQQMAALERRHWFWLGRRKILGQVLDSLELPPDASILEVGAGTGGNIPLLRRYGNLQAIEMDSFARAHAERSTGLEVLQGSLPESFPLSDQKFDLICMFDVLEHIDKSVESLSILSSCLKDGGRILITVPAYKWMWSEWDVQLHHKRRYSRALLRQELEQAGLTPMRISSFNTLMFPLAACVRLGSRLIGLKGTPGSNIPPKLLNDIAAKVFGAEKHALAYGDLPFGLSLLAIAARS